MRRNELFRLSKLLYFLFLIYKHEDSFPIISHQISNYNSNTTLCTYTFLYNLYYFSTFLFGRIILCACINKVKMSP